MSFLSRVLSTTRDIYAQGQNIASDIIAISPKVVCGIVAVPFHIAHIISSTAIERLTGRDTTNFNDLVSLNELLVERDKKIRALKASLSRETFRKRIYQFTSVTLAGLSAYLYFTKASC